MKFRTAHPSRLSGAAFTLPEFLVAAALMVLVVGAAMGAYIYGLRMLQFTKPKLGASDQARTAISLLTEDVRSAHLIKLGTRTSGGAFVPLPWPSAQISSAIRIQPTVSTNKYVIYFWDGSDPANPALKRTTNTTSGVVIADAVTNGMVFTAEDSRGNAYTNPHAGMVIGMTLRFNQIQFPRVAVGPGNYYDFYQLRAKINKRAYQ